MTQYIKFPDSYNTPSRWGGQDIPAHTKESLENYLIHGYPPGGFVTSVLTNDLYGAVSKADYENKTNITAITDWVINHAPPRTWGSIDVVNAWINDEDNRRTQYADAVMKAHTWDALKGEA